MGNSWSEVHQRELLTELREWVSVGQVWLHNKRGKTCVITAIEAHRIRYQHRMDHSEHSVTVTQFKREFRRVHLSKPG